MSKQIGGKVLVTGGGGFLGSRLVSLFLENDLQVRVLDIGKGLLDGRNDHGLEFADFGAGMLDRELVDRAMEGVEAVCHLAIDWGKALTICDLLDVNAKGTLNLLESARARGVKHFLYTSSVVVYGMSRFPRVDEESICKPETWDRDPGTNYSVMKLTLEKLALTYNYHHGLPATILRIGVAFDDNKALRTGRELSQKVLKDEPVQVARAVGRTSVHAEDVASAFYQAAMNRKAFGQIFNISNPSAFLTDLEVARVAIEAANSKSKIKVLPKPRTSPPIESTRKAQRLLGWKPKRGKADLIKSIVTTVRNARFQG